MNENTIPTENNVLDAIIQISEKSKGSELKSKILDEIGIQLNLVSDFLKITSIQALLVSNIFSLNYIRGGVDIDDIRKHFDCSPLTILRYKKDFEELSKRKIILKAKTDHSIPIALGEFEFIINRNIGDAILNNIPLEEKEQKKKDSAFDLLLKVKELIKIRCDGDLSTVILFNEVEELLLYYNHLTLVKKIERLKLRIEEKTLLLYLFYFAINGQDPVNIESITADLYNDARQRFLERKKIYLQQIQLFRLNLVKLWENVFVSRLEIGLTDKALSELFGKDANLLNDEMDIKSFKNVTPYELWFDSIKK